MKAGTRVLWAAADEVYGRCGEFRDALRVLSLAYVVIIPCDYRVALAKDKVIRADEAIAGAVFREKVLRERDERTPLQRLGAHRDCGPREFLLIRRLDRDRNQYTFHLCWAPDSRPATMTYFITIAGRRWPVETTFRTGKDAFGWDQSQARTWDAINRHTALTALAQLRTAAVRAALAGAAVLPAAQNTPAAVSEPAVSPADLQIYTGTAPLPVQGSQPCRLTSPRSGCPPPRPPASSASPATRNAGLLTTARLAFRLRWSAWRRRHRPAPAGTTTAPASQHSPPDPPLIRR